jgi:cobalt-zinc-cadmium efflux system membrane fusion protein
MRILPLIPVLLALAGCAKKPETGGQTARAEAAPADPDLIAVDAALEKRIRIGRPELRQIASELEVSARVEVDATRTSRIGSPVLGRVTEVRVEEGQDVHEGQLLAVLYSTGLNEAQLDFLKALSQRMVAERAVARAKTLLAADVIGAAELQRREAELAQATAELEAAREELVLLGMPPQAIAELEKTRVLKSVAWVTANRDGTLLRRHAAVGQVVQPADTMFEITDLRQVWVVADVPEKEVSHVRAGRPVSIRFDALPGREFRGEIAFVSPLVNPETRTVTVRVVLPNPQKLLKPAMLATLTILGHPQEMLCLPQSAFVREGDREYVFVRRQGNLFALTPVRSVAAGAQLRAVEEPDLSGTDVVVEGAFHLNNERRRRNIRGTE